MKIVSKSPKYVEWLSAELMHEESSRWLSELCFIKDEELFFEDLIKLFTFQLIRSESSSSVKEIIESVKKFRKKNINLIHVVLAHEKQLKIMVDGKDQLKEEDAYKEKHRALLIDVKKYFKEYRILKRKLFKAIKEIKKKEKQKRLLA